MKLHIHFQPSAVAPFKFENGYKISSHTCNHSSMLWLKSIHVRKCVPTICQWLLQIKWRMYTEWMSISHPLYSALLLILGWLRGSQLLEFTWYLEMESWQKYFSCRYTSERSLWCYVRLWTKQHASSIFFNTPETCLCRYEYLTCPLCSHDDVMTGKYEKGGPLVTNGQQYGASMFP